VNKKNLKSKNLFTSAIALAFIIQIVMTGCLFLSAPVQAQTKSYTMDLEIPIPTLNKTITFDGSTKPIADYVKAIYTFGVGIVGIVAAVVLMIAGVMWITAGGNSSNVSEAKSMITAALTGLVLVLTSYLLLDQINPALVNLQPTTIANITLAPPTPTSVNCDWTWGTGLGVIGASQGLSGKVYSGQSLCTTAKPAHDNAQCLCTYNKNQNLNCSWSTTATCPTGNIGIPVIHPDAGLDAPEPLGNLPAIKECGSSGYGASNICCCPPASLTCTGGTCSQVDPYITISAQKYGVDAKTLKSLIVAGEGCNPSKSSGGACGYGQEIFSTRSAICNIPGDADASCAAVQNNTQLDIDCMAILIKTYSAKDISAVASLYATGKPNICSNTGDNTGGGYCIRVKNFYSTCSNQ
jgi:hypothetical protein